VDDLRQRGLDVFVDYDTFVSGDKRKAFLERGLEESIHILYIVTEHSILRDRVPYELKCFWKNIHHFGRQKLIPILLRDCQRGEHLLQFSVVDFRNRNRYKEQLNGLANRLTRLPGLRIGPVRIHGVSETTRSAMAIIDRISRRIRCSNDALVTLELAAQELIRNAFDHANCTTDRFFIELQACETALSLRVQDSGKGFDLTNQLQFQQQAIQADPFALRGRGLLSLLDKAVLRNVISDHSHSILCEITEPLLVHVEGASAAARERAHYAYYFLGRGRTVCLAVNLKGLTAENSYEFKQCLLTCFSFDVDPVVVDLSHTTYIDASGLEALMSCRKFADASRRKLALVISTEGVRKTFLQTEMNRSFEIFPSVREAEAGLLRAS
jgi:anti-sigma B factor antagonist